MMSDLFAGASLPNGGDVAYFVHLHLDTINEHSEHPRKKDTLIYRVEGKARQMFVIKRLSQKERGKRWFLALPITSKGLNEAGHKRKGYQQISNCLDGKTESFVKWEVHRYPENMLHAKRGHPTVVTPCDPATFKDVLKIVMDRAQRGTLIVSSGVGSAPEG